MARRPTNQRTWGRAVLLVVCLLASACTGGGSAEPTRPAEQTTTSATGEETRTETGGIALGAKFDWGRFDTFSSYVAGLQGAPTFYELVWCDIEERQGSLDWSAPDRIVALAQEVDAQLMLKIRVGQCWTTGQSPAHVRGSSNKTESGMPTDISAYTAFVSQVVSRYAPKGVHTYAVENEINSAGMWSGSVADYVTLITAAAAAIRDADPRGVVVDCGLASSVYGYGIAKRLLDADRVEEAIAAYNEYFVNRIGVRNSIVKVHSQGDLEAALTSDQAVLNLQLLGMATTLLKTKVADVRQIHFYETSASVPALMDYLHATTPPSVPIEAWEVGSFVRGQQVAEDVATIELTRKVSLLLGAGVRKVLWLPLIVNPSGRNSDEPRIGLIDPSGAVRPLGTVFAQMASDAAGAQASPVDERGVVGVTLAKGGQHVSYLWSTGGAVTTTGEGITSVVGSAPVTSISSTPVRAPSTGTLEGLLK